MKTNHLSRALLAFVLATLTVSLPAFASTKTLNSGATTLDTAGNWTPSGIPTTTDEALIDATNAQTALTLSTQQTFGDLLINNNSLASMSLTGATSRTITVSGGGGSTAATAAGGVAGDLLLLGTNVVSSVTIGGGSGAGVLNLGIGANGNFNVVNSAATAVVTGSLGGSFNLTKTGAGALTLSGANSFGTSGVTTFTLGAGTLNVNSASAFGNGGFQINGGTTLNNTSSAAITTISGSSFVINGDFTYAGGGSGASHDLTIRNETTNLGAEIGTSRTITVAAANSTLGFLGSIGNGTTANSLIKAGAGTLLLTSGTFTGGTTLNAGTILVNGSTALGAASTATINGGTLASASATGYSLGQNFVIGGDFTLGQASGGTGILTLGGAGNTMSLGGTTRTITVNNSTNTIIAPISGAGGITKEGPGTLVLQSATDYSYTGNVTLNAGMLKVSTTGISTTLGTGASAMFFNGGDLLIAANGSRNYGRNATVSANTTITSDRGSVGSATYTLGTLSIGAQTLTTVGGSVATTSGLTFGATTLTGSSIFTVNNGSTATMLLTLGTIANGGFTPTFNGTGNVTISGIISGNGGLTQSGTGTVTLTNANTYNGTTTVSSGTLAYGGTSALGAGAVTVSGGTLALSTFSDTVGAVTLSSGNITSTTGVLTGTSYSLTDKGSVSAKLGGVGVALTKTGGGTATLSAINTYTGATTVNAGTLALDFTAVANASGNQANHLASTSALALGGGTFTVTGVGAGGANSAVAWTALKDSPTLTFATLPTGVVVGQPVTGTGIPGSAYVVSIDSTKKTIAINANATALSGDFTTSATTPTTSQTFASTAVNAGASSLSVNANSGGGTSLVLGAITRSVGGTVSVTNPTGTLSSANSIRTTSGSASTLLTDNGVAYATIGTTDWAGKDSTNAWIAAPTYTAATTTALSGNADLSVASQDTTLATGASITSLRFSDSTAHTITISSGTLTTGGILVSSAITTNTQTITGGFLQSAASASGKDLTAIVNSTSGGLTINSTIINAAAGSTGLTKAGTGTLTLTGNNTFSGTTSISAGTLEAGAAGALGSTSGITVATGGTLLVSAAGAIGSSTTITMNSTITGNGTAAALTFSSTYNGTVGALTLTQNTIFDLGTNADGVKVHFASITGLDAFTLSVYNWTGTTLWEGGIGDGIDQIYAGGDPLTSTQLENISFYSGLDNSSFVGKGFQIPTGSSFASEVMPVPEPSTWVAMAALVLTGAFFKRKRQNLSLR